MGVPAGTTFTKTVSGDYTASTAGEVINAWHITGNLIIKAKNVSITDSQIDGDVDNEVGSTQYGPFTITDSTVGSSTCSGHGGFGIGQSNFTARRVLVQNHEDGFRVSGNNVSVYDSYVSSCLITAAQSPPDGGHNDGIQAYCPSGPCGNVLLQHNTIDMCTMRSDGSCAVPSTNALNVTDANLTDVSMINNLVLGGGYTVDSHWHSGANWTFTDNRVVNKEWAYGPVTTESTCSHQAWTGNTLVTIDSGYKVTSTVSPLACIN